MDRPVKMAFEPEGRTIPISQLLPLRLLSDATRSSTKFKRIAASIAQVGVIEPIVVFPQNGVDGRGPQYLIIDGHLRYEVLKERGEAEVFCLISTDDDSFTYNHKVNQMAPIQEHFMIMRALESGVSEERIAATLNVDVAAIRRKRDLLEGICKEAVELLRDQRASPGALRELRRVQPMRQIEMVELMLASKNFSLPYAKCLVAATPQDQLLEPDRPKEIQGLRPEDIARIEREMQTIEKDFRLIEDSHGKNVLNLVVAAGYVRGLLENAAVVKFLSRKYAAIYSELEKIAEATNLGAQD